MKSRFITIEGGEGAGKSTNIAFIRDYLVARGIEVVVTREPGGTPLGESIRKLLLESECVETHAELLLVFAARSQHIEQVIRPLLDKGIWVLSDRFTDASYAYQGSGRGLDQSVIDFLQNLVQHGLQPDLTLLLDLPVKQGMKRVERRGKPDRFETEKLEFFSRVRTAYLARAQAFPDRIRRIDASGTLEQVQTGITHHLDQLISSSE